MDLRNWYFKQIVSQGDLDEMFDWVQDADHSIVEDLEFPGIISGGDGTENSPPDLNALLGGPIIAYDKEGQRTYDATLSQLVDCSEDEYGNTTAVGTPGDERWISVFIRFNRRLEDPEIDGNNNEVYTKLYEDAEIFVRQGAAAVIPTATRPAILSDALLLFDLYRINGQTTFLNADFDVTRREDWYRFVGTTLGTIVHGTAHEAVEDLYTLLDGWATAIPFSFTEDWYGSVAPAGPAPPVTTIQEALDAVVYDLAQSTGAAKVGAANYASTYVSWSSKSMQGAVEAVAAALNTHIGGAAPFHPATAITFSTYSWLSAANVQLTFQEVVDDLAATGAGTSGVTRIGAQAIAGTPESIVAGPLNTLLTAIYSHLNARTERATVETVSANWWFTGNTEMKSRFGGGLPPDALLEDVCSRKTWGTRKTWAQMWEAANSHTCTAAPTDLCCAKSGKDVYVLALTPSNVRAEIINPRDLTVTDYANIAVTGAPTPTAFCCDGSTVYVMYNNDTVSAWTFGPAPGGAAWAAKWGPVALPATASGSYDRIAVVSDIYIMTANSGLDSNTGGCFTRMLRTDGTSVVSGIGSMTVNANNYPRGGIASCGTTFYATALDALTPANAELVEIDPATMGDPGHFVGGNPAGAAATNIWPDIVCDGSLIWITESKVAPGALHTYPVEENVTAFKAIEYALPANYFAKHLVFDGFNIWFTRRTTALATPNGTDLQSVPAGDVSGVGGRTAAGAIVRQTQSWNDIAAPNPGKMTFDGDAVWSIQDTVEYPLVICRVPHAPDRC